MLSLKTIRSTDILILSPVMSGGRRETTARDAFSVWDRFQSIAFGARF